LCKKAFFGEIPFPVIHLDTGKQFPEMYEFRQKLAREWNLDLLVVQNEQALKAGVGPEHGRFECCTALKTLALRKAIEKHGFDALLLAIRRDEHGIRAKERYFSLRDIDFRWDYRDQPLEMWDQYQKATQRGAHTRVHPMLHWREIDIWRYTQLESIPVNPMYFAKNGKRYRSLGCMPCTNPIDSDADTIEKIIAELERTKTAERAGRAQDKEQAFMMQKLRALGYM
jgi:sulfate adenylyltransferase subunit 2